MRAKTQRAAKTEMSSNGASQTSSSGAAGMSFAEGAARMSPTATPAESLMLRRDPAAPTPAGESDSADTFATSGGIAAGGSGAKPSGAAPGVSDYSGQRPDATTFEHGESGSADVFSLYASNDDDEGGAPDTAMSRDNAPAASAAPASSEPASEPAAETASEPAAEAASEPAPAAKPTKRGVASDSLANANRGKMKRDSDE